VMTVAAAVMVAPLARRDGRPSLPRRGRQSAT